MRKDKRAISPIVATVILISIAIVLALVIWLFVKGFVSELVVKLGKPAATVCEEDVSIDASLEFDSSSAVKNVIVENNGNVPIAGFNLELERRGSAKRNYYPCAILQGQSSPTAPPCIDNIASDFEGLESNCETATVIPVLLGTGQSSGKEKLSTCETKAVTLSCSG